MTCVGYVSIEVASIADEVSSLENLFRVISHLTADIGRLESPISEGPSISMWTFKSSDSTDHVAVAGPGKGRMVGGGSRAKDEVALYT